MGAKQSTAASSNSPRVRTFSSSVSSPNGTGGGGGGGGTATATASAEIGLLRPAAGNNSSADSNARQRARSLSSVPNGHSAQPISIPPAGAAAFVATAGGGGGLLPESDSSTPDETAPFGRVFVAHSLPAQLWSFNGIKCPVCSKFVLPDDVECHLVMCLTKPRISYNEDVLTEDKGECVICLDDLKQGDTIARLPCLCIYHKSCIDSWFEVNRSCPEHPLD